jgi:hypothetical protein
VPKKAKLTFVVFLIVLIVVAGGYLVGSRKSVAHTPQKANTASTPINLNPPTRADLAIVDQHKEALSNHLQQQNSTSPRSTKSTVIPIIVDASQYDQKIEVRSYVPGIYESDGTCTVTFSKGLTKITKTVPALSDATTVRCTNVDVGRAEFSVGSWSVTVNYVSPSTSGTSSERKFEVT